MSARRRKRRDPWWSTWPGALALGASSLLLVLPWLIAGLTLLLLPGYDAAGVDRGGGGGPGAFVRIVVAVLGGVSLALPPLTIRWARKIWLGYVLLGVTFSAGFCIVGLVLLGIL